MASHLEVAGAPTPLIARPATGLWGVIVVWAIVGLAILLAGIFAVPGQPRPGSDVATDQQIGAAILALFFALPCALGAWLMRRVCLVAEARGLLFCGVWRTHFVAWPEVEDYELRLARDTDVQQAWVRGQGKWRAIPTYFAPKEELRAFIQRHAQSSRAREWQLDVLRADGNWPKTWVYPKHAARKFALVWVGLVALLIALNFISPFLEVVKNAPDKNIFVIWRGLDASTRTSFLAASLAMALLYSLLFLPRFLFERAKSRFAGETIEADLLGLTWRKGEAQERFNWDEISDYHLEDVPGFLTIARYVVESGGRRIVFGEVEKRHQLCALIEANAKGAASREWRHRAEGDSDTLGGAASLHDADGRTIHHYRTRTVRALLLFGLAMLPALAIRMSGTTPLSNGQMPTLTDQWVGVPFVFLALVGVGATALAFWRANVSTGEDGVRHNGIFGAQFLRWDEIESLEYNGYFYTLAGANTKIRFGPVAACADLIAQIEARGNVKCRRTDRPND